VTKPEEISYEQFGVRFLELGVTPERVATTLHAIAGDVIEVGPLDVGPANAASVVARGAIAPPRVDRLSTSPLRFRALLSVELSLDVSVAGTQTHYDARLRVPLDLTVRTAEPLDLVIDVARVSARDVEVDLKASGVRARVLQRLGNVEVEIRRHVAKFVRDRIDDPKGVAARRLELLPLIDEAWQPR
jgi:hypothetical protein